MRRDNLTTQLNGQMRFRNYMFYALDDWKVTPRLTVNLGIRYELTSPWYDKHDNMNRLEIEDQRGSTDHHRGHCAIHGLAGLEYRYQQLGASPRLSLAAGARTVLRAGAGVFTAAREAQRRRRGINNFL
jgi:outer membrane receptor protein involved in Fe transport